MDGTDSTGAVSYSWKEVGTSAPVFTGPTPTFLLTQGTKTIRLTITGADGSTDTDDVVITVLAGAAALRRRRHGPDRRRHQRHQRPGPARRLWLQWRRLLRLEPARRPPGRHRPEAHRHLPIGSFSITLTTTSASGATRIDTVVITVQKPPPSSSVSGSQGPVGTVLDYSFIGFPSNTQVNIFFVGGGASVQTTQINSNASGVGSGSLVRPDHGRRPEGGPLRRRR